MPSLTNTNTKASKVSLGRTATARTPLAIRTKLGLAPAFKAHVRERLGRALDTVATRIERGTVRFDDTNGPRGGVDTVCKIKIVMSGHREGIIVEQVGVDAAEAFGLAVSRVARAVRKVVDKKGGRTPKATLREAASDRPSRKKSSPKTLIGRTVGRSAERLQDALDRPEKRRGDAFVDTAAPGVAADDRRAGGPHTARRNTKASTEGMTATLEDSLTKPSRKSTRRSADRQKSATKIEQRVKGKLSSPQTRAQQR